MEEIFFGGGLIRGVSQFSGGVQTMLLGERLT